MNVDIDLKEYMKQLMYFLDNAMDSMVLFMIFQGRWANRVLSDIVIQAFTRFIVKSWNEKTLEEIAWDILVEIEEYVMENE